MSNSSTRKRQKSRVSKNHRIVKKMFFSSDDEDSLSTKDARFSRVKQEMNSTDELLSDESSSGNVNVELKTPRSSSRLKEKASRSFTLPSRESALQKITPGGSHSAKARKCRPRRLINNFVRERSTYVTERNTGVFSDSDMSDFIVDDEEEGSSEDDVMRSKTKLKSKKKLVEKSKQFSSSSDSSSSDVPLSKFAKKMPKKRTSSYNENRPQQKVKKHISSDDCESENSDDNDFLSRTSSHKKRKRYSVIESSNSDSDTARKSFIDNKIDSDSSHDVRENNLLTTRPCSNRLEKMRRKQEEKHSKLFGALIQKRKKGHKNFETKKSSELMFTSSESDQEEEKEREQIENSSEIDSNESDRDFVVEDDEDEESDTGMNSEREFELLEMLRLYSRKLTPEREIGLSFGIPSCNNYNGLNVKQRKKKKRRKWQRVVKRESEESDSSEDEELNDLQLPLHASVMSGKIDEVIDYLERDPKCVFDVDAKNRTALHLASIVGNSEILKTLLDAGSDIYTSDSRQLTATAYAADGHPECLELILNHISVKDGNKSIRQNDKQMSLLHFAVGCSRDGSKAFDRAKCLQLIYERDKKKTHRLLNHQDYRGFTPLVAAVNAGQHQCVAVLLDMGSNPSSFKTERNGSLLHFVVDVASQLKSAGNNQQSNAVTCLKHLLGIMKSDIEKSDIKGFTPLMYACESGNQDCVKTLLESGASVKAKDKHGTSALHLAAMCGSTECVQLLLHYSHQVDCLDKYGWPPLLYANFKAQESCVLSLMKPNPRQIFVLGKLLENSNNEVQRKKSFKMVRNVLVSLANHDAYYTVFNDFIRDHPEMLEEHNGGLLQHTWRVILDFDNKRRWFRKKVEELRDDKVFNHLHLDVDRKDVLGSAMRQLGRSSGCLLRQSKFNVTFEYEPGICTGPKREFFSCFCKDIVSAERGLFMATDDSQYSPLPSSYFASYSLMDDQKPVNTRQDQKPSPGGEQHDTTQLADIREECTDEELLAAEQEMIANINTGEVTANSDTRTETNTSGTEAGISPVVSKNEKSCSSPSIFSSLRQKLEQLRFIGRIVGAAICQRMLLNLPLSKPFLKQVLGIPLSHPEDLGSFDHQLHKNAVIWVLKNTVEDLDLPFSIDIENPWNKKTITIPLDGDADKILDDSNKRDYVKLVSQFKLEKSIKNEVEEFSGGLNEVIPKKLLSLFTADEFSLLLNGVAKIDVEDWKQNTIYKGASLSEKSQLITWFWNVVEQLKEEEKALLIQFTTGTSCIPVGGFAALQGLSGPTRFTIMKLDCHNKVPQAATCFNMLKLSDYDTEKQLREKLLIAIRHGAEGFSFG